MSLQVKAEKYQEVIDKALKKVIEMIKTTNDTYTLAVVAYALQMTDHPIRNEVLQNLLNKAETTGIA